MYFSRVAIAILISANYVSAQINTPTEQRALLVGIDKYTPPDYATGIKFGARDRADFVDLHGCKNDAQSIKSAITHKFNFKESNITELYDEQGTRQNILNNINALLNKSNPGDIAFIYYAGHGSQIVNSKSKEEDKLDETIVPSDTWKQDTADIRDKELARIFNSFLDKGVKLTVIFDCCHSGSIARGDVVYAQPVTRYMKGSDFDVKDGSNPPDPVENKSGDFLLIAASQDWQTAAEQTENNVPHGAFTIALLNALNQHSPKTPVENLFLSAQEVIKANGKVQVPVITASPERKRQNLFGIDNKELKDELLIAVHPEKNGIIKIDGGFAIGLSAGNELTKIIDSNNNQNKSAVVRIDTVLSLTESEGSIISGSIKDISAGNLFKISRWNSVNGPLLKIFIPSPYSYDSVNLFASINSSLKNSTKLKWTNDLQKNQPDVSTFFNNNAAYVSIAREGIKKLNRFTTANIESVAKNRTLFVNLPPVPALVAALKNSFSAYGNMKIVDNPREAQYTLYGTIDDNNKLAYGLMRSEISVADSLSSLPLRTDFISLQDNNPSSYQQLADSILMYSLRLAKVRGWITMSPPPDAGHFPYHIELRKIRTNERIDPSKGTRIGDTLTVHMVADSGYLSETIRRKFVYAFAISQDGSMTLIYPSRNAGTNENLLPVYNSNGECTKELKLINGAIKVRLPAGTDNYFLLATEVAIHDYVRIFSQSGVNATPRSLTNPSPLDDLLNMGNIGARSPQLLTPANWNLIKLPVKTSY